MPYVVSPDLTMVVSLPMATVGEIEADLDTAIRLGRALSWEFDDDDGRGYLLLNPGRLATILVTSGAVPGWARDRPVVRVGPSWVVPDVVPTRPGEPVLDVRDG